MKTERSNYTAQYKKSVRASFGIPLEKPLWDKFRTLADERCINKTELITAYIKKWVDKNSNQSSTIQERI